MRRKGYSRRSQRPWQRPPLARRVKPLPQTLSFRPCPPALREGRRGITAHLAGLRAPALIVQGERDPFGSREEVERYQLSQAIRIEWIPDGDHSLKSRKKSGRTEKQNLAQAISAVTNFVLALSGEISG